MFNRHVLSSIGTTLAVVALVALPLTAATKPAATKSVPKPAAPKAASVEPTEEERFVKLIDKALPSVVSITISEARKVGREVVGRGTGFFIDSAGLIVTNKHVVSNTTATFTAYLADGQRYPATVVARDPLFDIAFLKINAEGFPALPLANSDTVQVGQTTIVVGNSLGRYSNTVTRGIVSGIGRSLTASDSQGNNESLEDVIQTDAEINLGNSGGPLLNSRGEVIGMNTAIDQTGRGVGFATPSNDIASALASYRRDSRIVRAFLGVRYMTITPDLQDELGLAYQYGALIKAGELSGQLSVVPDSPAARAGIQENDIILSLNTRLIRGRYTLLRAVQATKAGATAELKVYRQGAVIPLTVTLAELPTP